MVEVRIELLSRVHFVRTFPSASLEYSKTPWVQVANLFGSIACRTGPMPLLISSRTKGTIQVFVFDGEWKRLEVIKTKELDPDEVLAEVLRTMKRG